MKPSNETTKLPTRSEHDEQCALFDWAAITSIDHPELLWMFSIPNGGLRNKAVAAKLKAEGVKAGVFDIFLPAARLGYHGLFIEMKVGKNTLTGNQRAFRHFMELRGYRCAVCYGWEAAASEIRLYLKGRPS